MEKILEIKDRTKSAKTAPADGLYLAMIEYPEKYGIPVPVNSRCAIPAAATV
jgi:tRNA pseudouridine38-40 synthase